jgi:hypothetical protein
MNRKILGLLAPALLAGLIAATAAQAQIYQYNITIDPLTYNGETYAGGSVSFTLPNGAFPDPVTGVIPLQSVSLSSDPVFNGLSLSSVGIEGYGVGNCTENGPCTSITEYLLGFPYVASNFVSEGAAGRLLDVWTPWIPGAPGSGQFAYPDGGGFGSGFGFVISNGCNGPSCNAYYNVAYTGGTIDVVAVAAPEIDPATALSGLTLLLGGVFVVRGRRAKPLPL